jgi:hypothetical protein
MLQVANPGIGVDNDPIVPAHAQALLRSYEAGRTA